MALPSTLMVTTAEQIKELREKTGAGISDIKKALEESGGDIAKAQTAIERRLGGSAAKKAGRVTGAGLVDAYVHLNGRIGVIVELLCETDFVARNPTFKELAHDVALHITAMAPLFLSIEDVPQDVWQSEKARFLEEANKLGKPPHIVEEIVDGKLKAHFGVLSLLEQPFIKDQDKMVKDIVNEAVGKFGENIKIGRFARIEI